MVVENPRLGLPRKDVGKWGAITNKFLRVAHNENGTLKRESVFGTSIGAGLLLDGAVLKASEVLQKYHGIDPSGNVQSLLGAADYAAIKALLGLGTEATPLFFGLQLGQGATPDGRIEAIGTYGSGSAIVASGTGTRLIWNPKKAAFRAGFCLGTAWDDANVGNYSFGIGQTVEASGHGSFAVGWQAKATNTGAVAMGSGALASGEESFAVGHLTIASGGGSFAAGNGCVADGSYSFAHGISSEANGNYSTALGYDIHVSGHYSFGIALNNQGGANVAQANTLAIMGGKVGLGTLAPATIFDARGTGTFGAVNVTDQALGYRIGGVSLITLNAVSNIEIGADVCGGTSDWGLNNVFIGSEAGYNNAQVATTQRGRYNVYIGKDAGKGVTADTDNTGMYNVGVGYQTFLSNTTGQMNFALGFYALRDNTSGSQNVAIGTYALQHNTTSWGNVAIGRGAGAWNTDPTGGNVLIGTDAGIGTEGTAHYNDCVFIGRFCGKTATTAFQNVIIGSYAGDAITSGYGDTVLGCSAAGLLTSGAYNTTIGYYAGARLTTGHRNIFLGRRAGARQTTSHDRLIIDNWVRASAAEELTNAIIYGVMAANPADQSLRFNANIFLTQVKAGATQGGAGAAADEIWKTVGHVSLPDNVLMIGA